VKSVGYGFIPLAAVGFGLSVVVHLMALFGRPSPLGGMWWVLHVGMFVVFIPALLVQQRLTKGFKPKERWDAALRGCPAWVPRALQALAVYALVNFIRFAWAVQGKPQAGGEPPPEVMWGFSGHWMLFYAAAWAMLYSAARTEEVDASSRCLNGHRLPPSPRYCDRCGSPVAENVGGTADGGQEAGREF
jgi:hypothetical protein